MTKPRGTAFAAFSLGIALAVAMAAARAQSSPAQSGGAMPATGQAAPAGKTAGETGKNIQVLKDIPTEELVPTMQFIAASLNVECNFCHVETDGKLQPDKDDKPEKLTARKMITMVMAINKDNFNARTEVTCYSCHRGAHEPTPTPVIADVAVPPQPSTPTTPAANVPTADQLLDKYVQALGGADAINKVTTRIEKGNIEAQGQKFSIEIYAKAPDKRIAVTHQGNGESYTAFDGQTGWMGNSGRPARDMNPADVQSGKIDATFHLATDLKQLFPRLRAGPPEKIGDKEFYVLYAAAPGRPPVKLYFDEQTGLLARLMRYTQTPLGRLPVQIDYADYRDVDGTKVPFRWTLARVNGRFTIQIDQAQQNVPIDDSKFAKPAAPAGSGPGPGGPQH
jgi:photosynthetic reaction center cytochrome c subunit